jgi:hypothetical protein
MEGLQKERTSPDPGSWRRIHDCLLSSGIPSQVTFPLSNSPPGIPTIPGEVSMLRVSL